MKGSSITPDRVLRAYQAFPWIRPAKGTWVGRNDDGKAYACPLTILRMHELGYRPFVLYGDKEGPSEVECDLRLPEGYQTGFLDGWDGDGRISQNLDYLEYEQGKKDAQEVFKAIQKKFGRKKIHEP